MTTNKYGKVGWSPDKIGDFSGKTYVITDATSGTGMRPPEYCSQKEPLL